MWATWTISRSECESAAPTENIDVPMATVSFERVRELQPRLSTAAVAATRPAHQLVRFNLYNFGEEPVVVCGIALQNVHGDRFECTLLPSITVGAGARYPVVLEVVHGPVTEIVHAEVDDRGRRFWVTAQTLPRF